MSVRAPTPVADPGRGIAMAASAYGIWGLFPLYFKALTAPPLIVLAHRVAGTLLFLGLWVSARGLGHANAWAWLPKALGSRVTLGRGILSAGLLGVNWLVYIWAVQAGRVVDASLGYFITPLFSVLLGVLCFGERLRVGQRVALGLAALGVSWLTWKSGQFPWIGLSLALSFGGYGAVRKVTTLGSAEGLWLETFVLLPLAAGYLFIEPGTYLLGPSGLDVTLLCAGPLTAVPLVLFGAGARRVPLSVLGVLQYLAPSLQLLLGLWLWKEPFGPERAVGYGLIWLAVALFTAEGALLRRRAA